MFFLVGIFFSVIVFSILLAVIIAYGTGRLFLAHFVEQGRNFDSGSVSSYFKFKITLYDQSNVTYS